MKQIEKDIFEFIKEAHPNKLSYKSIYGYFFYKYSEEKIKNTLEKLTKKKNIKEDIFGPEKKEYSLKSPVNITIEEYLDFGTHKIPRLLGTDLYNIETTNIAMKSLMDTEKRLKKIIKDSMEKELKKYWGNIIVIFGLFMSVFSLIITSINKIEIGENWSVKELFLYNLAQVLPIAIILFLFLFILKKMFK